MPGYPNALGPLPPPYVPIPEMSRPQLVGVNPFVYPPAGIQGIQQQQPHSSQPQFHQQYPQQQQQQYQLRNQQQMRQQQMHHMQLQQHLQPPHYQQQLQLQQQQQVQLQQPPHQIQAQQQCHNQVQQQFENQVHEKKYKQPIFTLPNQNTNKCDPILKADDAFNLPSYSTSGSSLVNMSEQAPVPEITSDQESQFNVTGSSRDLNTTKESSMQEQDNILEESMVILKEQDQFQNTKKEEMLLIKSKKVVVNKEQDVPKQQELHTHDVQEIRGKERSQGDKQEEQKGQQKQHQDLNQVQEQNIEKKQQQPQQSGKTQHETLKKHSHEPSTQQHDMAFSVILKILNENLQEESSKLEETKKDTTKVRVSKITADHNLNDKDDRKDKTQRLDVKEYISNSINGKESTVSRSDGPLLESKDLVSMLPSNTTHDNENQSSTGKELASNFGFDNLLSSLKESRLHEMKNVEVPKGKEGKMSSKRAKISKMKSSKKVPELSQSEDRSPKWNLMVKPFNCKEDAALPEIKTLAQELTAAFEESKNKHQDEMHPSVTQDFELNLASQVSESEEKLAKIDENDKTRFYCFLDTKTTEENSLAKQIAEEDENTLKAFVHPTYATKPLNTTAARHHTFEVVPNINNNGINLLSNFHGAYGVSNTESTPVPPYCNQLPTLNNMQQHCGFGNSHFPPKPRHEGINKVRKPLAFYPAHMFNHQTAQHMSHMMPQNQNETFTTTTHYDPVMIPSPLLVPGVPCMTGPTGPSYMTRSLAPIPIPPPQPWSVSIPPPQPWSVPIPPPQPWSVPMPLASLPMVPQLPIQVRMQTVSCPPFVPAVLPYAGFNRAAPEYYPRIDRPPKVNTDNGFQPPLPPPSNIQMKPVNVNEESHVHLTPLKFDSHLKNIPFIEKHGFKPKGRDFHCPVINLANFGRNKDVLAQIPNNEKLAQGKIPQDLHPSKIVSGVTFYEHLIDESTAKKSTPNKFNVMEAFQIKKEQNLNGGQDPRYALFGSFKQPTKTPCFNRSVRELISVPFTSDESRLLYLLKKRQQGHPIAQEWAYFCGGPLTSHFRKLWDQPKEDEDKLETGGNTSTPEKVGNCTNLNI